MFGNMQWSCSNSTHTPTLPFTKNWPHAIRWYSGNVCNTTGLHYFKSEIQTRETQPWFNLSQSFSNFFSRTPFGVSHCYSRLTKTQNQTLESAQQLICHYRAFQQYVSAILAPPLRTFHASQFKSPGFRPWTWNKLHFKDLTTKTNYEA